MLDTVDLDVQPGEAVALVGENGAGKTTLLRICAGLIRADAGTVTVDGRIGYCPQQATFLESLRVDEHLILFGRATASVEPTRACRTRRSWPVSSSRPIPGRRSGSSRVAPARS